MITLQALQTNEDREEETEEQTKHEAYRKHTAT